MESNWEDLPAELLVQILSLVDDRTVVIACGVCTAWRDVMGSGISQLSFKWCNRNISELVQSVAPKFSKLQACQLWNSGPYLRDEAVKALAYNCHDLQDVDLSKGTLITDDSLYALADGCRSLKKLNLSGCSKISEQAVISVAEHCKSLNNLNLCGCNKAGTDKALLALARNCVTLEVLNLGWCEGIADVGVTGLASWCSDLKSIDLCGCVHITDQSVIALADKCHYLRVLGLYNCCKITDAAMYAIANSSKYRGVKANLQQRFRENTNLVTERRNRSSSSGSYSISSSSCSNDEGSTLTSCNYSKRSRLEEAPGLTSLNVGMCKYLSAPAVQAVVDAFPGLHTCAERHSLNISACLHLTSVHCACVAEARKHRQ